MKAARRVVDTGVEFAPRMQRRHDDLERRLLFELRMGIDRDTPAIVGHGQPTLGVQFDVDPGRLSRQRLIHGVVDDLGEEMMQRLFIRSPDIHAGPAAHRLKALQDLDIGCRVAFFRGGAGPGLAGLYRLGFELVLKLGKKIARRCHGPRREISRIAREIAANLLRIRVLLWSHGGRDLARPMCQLPLAMAYVKTPPELPSGGAASDST